MIQTKDDVSTSDTLDVCKKNFVIVETNRNNCARDKLSNG